MDDRQAEFLSEGRRADLHRIVLMADSNQELAKQRRAILRTVDVYDRLVAIDLTVDDVFTCRCPFNENVDTASVRIQYEPLYCIVELASLRDYLHMAFAHEAIAHEDVISLIWQDLMMVLGLVFNDAVLFVEMTFASVEGVGMTIRKTKGYTSPRPPQRPSSATPQSFRSPLS